MVVKSADSLGDRMKKYESATTGVRLMDLLPLYARIDGRAFHTFTRGLDSQFPVAGAYSHQLYHAMRYVCKNLVREFNADVGFVQSDEISLGWVELSKAPFDGKLFKLESILASAATGFFNKFAFDEDIDSEYGLSNDRLALKKRVLKVTPMFDCRVIQFPNLEELANCFVWRENDAVKNTISGYAMEYFSSKQLHGKTQDDRLKMLSESGHAWEDLPIENRRGTYYKRVVVNHKADDGTTYCRTHVVSAFTHERISKIYNKVGYLFFNENPILNTESADEPDIVDESYKEKNDEP